MTTTRRFLRPRDIVTIPQQWKQESVHLKSKKVQFMPEGLESCIHVVPSRNSRKCGHQANGLEWDRIANSTISPQVKPGFNQSKDTAAREIVMLGEALNNICT